GGAFGSPYYGSVDATPLFVWLAAEAARWIPEAHVIAELEPALRRALRWMDQRGDMDGDGFIEYQRRAPRGIRNQVWKDSHDSLLDDDARRPEGPIAAVEVQAYAYAAWRALAEVTERDDPRWSKELNERAATMRAAFERAFWIDERRNGSTPVPYPVACSPQAWTAAAAFLCARTILGLELSSDGRRVTLDPILPDGVDRFEAHRLRAGRGVLDIRVTKRGRRAVVSAILASGVDVTVR